MSIELGSTDERFYVLTTDQYTALRHIADTLWLDTSTQKEHLSDLADQIDNITNNAGKYRGNELFST